MRHRCALALASITEKSADVVLPRDALLRLARELESPIRVLGETGRPGPDDDGLDLVFTLMSLAFEREPVELAARALRSQDRRFLGTALEYLETVLPDELRRALFVRLDVGARERGATRPAQELLAELLKSSHLVVSPRRPSGPRSEE